MKKRKIYKIEVTNAETQKSKIFEVEADSRNQAEKTAVKWMKEYEKRNSLIDRIKNVFKKTTL